MNDTTEETPKSAFPAVAYLAPSMLGELMRFWKESFPLHTMNESLLNERVFGPPDACPENSLCYLDDGGKIIGISLVVPPAEPVENGEKKHKRKHKKKVTAVGGIRWFGVHPQYRKMGYARALMKDSFLRLHELGATEVNFLTTPPYYIQPGVDIRQTDLIAWLMGQGFEHVETHFNMEADYASLTIPPDEKIFGVEDDDYIIRRATEADREEFEKHCEKEWTAGWCAEGLIGLKHDPVSLFLAIHRNRPGKSKDKIVGFATYESNQCLGCFGPAGVSPEHQGLGIGGRLLWATMKDLKALGREKGQIGWIGPMEFYYRLIGATLGPVFWAMRKRLKPVMFGEE